MGIWSNCWFEYNFVNLLKMCSSCGKLTSKELSDRLHECSLCELIMDRDLNASKKNILRIGESIELYFDKSEGILLEIETFR